VKPGTFLDKTAEATGPLGQEFIDIVAAHLVDNQQNYQFGARGRLL
jgi:hypothetical protein